MVRIVHTSAATIEIMARVDRGLYVQSVLNDRATQTVGDVLADTLVCRRGLFKVVLCRTGTYFDNDQIAGELKSLLLVPVNPCLLAFVNKSLPRLAGLHPNGTQWRNGSDEWCYIIFSRWQGKRSITAGHSEYGWRLGLWIAGVHEVVDD